MMPPAEPTIHDNRPVHGGGAQAPVPDDLVVEAAVLALLLDLYPAPITSEELRRRMLATDHAPFAERDAVDRAVTQILAHGAAHDAGGWLIASQTAVYTARIDR
jgi:hypothetical protein